MDKYIFSLYVMSIFVTIKFIDIKFVKKEEVKPKYIIRDSAIIYLSSVGAFFFNDLLSEGENLKNRIAVYTGDAGF